jgi:hypothetical protein
MDLDLLRAQGGYQHPTDNGLFAIPLNLIVTKRLTVQTHPDRVRPLIWDRDGKGHILKDKGGHLDSQLTAGAPTIITREKTTPQKQG